MAEREKVSTIEGKEEQVRIQLLISVTLEFMLWNLLLLCLKRGMSALSLHPLRLVLFVNATEFSSRLTHLAEYSRRI